MKLSCGAVVSAVDSCEAWVWTQSKAPVDTLNKKPYTHCTVLVGSRNRFKCVNISKISHNRSKLDKYN